MLYICVLTSVLSSAAPVLPRIQIWLKLFPLLQKTPASLSNGNVQKLCLVLLRHLQSQEANQPTPTTTSELVPLTASEESPSGKREMKYNADGILVSTRDGRALASQLFLKKKYSNTYRNPDNKQRCYA